MVELVVALAPAARDGVRGRQDDVATLSPAGRVSAKAALDSPIRGRSSKTSTSPRRSPRTSTEPRSGCMRAPAICSSVVFPAPFGPRIDPALTLADRPRHVLQERGTVPDDRDADEVEHVTHDP